MRVAWTDVAVFIVGLATIGTLLASGDLDGFPGRDTTIGGIDAAVATVTTDGRTIAIDFRAPMDEAPDESQFRISVNGATPRPPSQVLLDQGRLLLAWPGGFGADDVIEVQFSGGNGLPAIQGIVQNHAPAGILPTPRSHGAAAVVAGSVFLFGGVDHGLDGQVTPITSVQRYDPLTGHFRTMNGTLPVSVIAPQAVVDSRSYAGCTNGCIYLFGGRSTIEPTPPEPRVIQYDIAGDVTRELGTVLPSNHDPAYRAVMMADHILLHYDESTEGDGGPNTGGLLTFNPATGETLILPPYTPVSKGSTAMAWTTGNGCPSGCAFLFGRWDVTEPSFEATPTREDDALASHPIGFDPLYEYAPMVTSTATVQGHVWPNDAAFVNGKTWLLHVSDCRIDCSIPTHTAAWDPVSDIIERHPLLVPSRAHAAWAVGDITYAFGGLRDGQPLTSIDVVDLRGR